MYMLQSLHESHDHEVLIFFEDLQKYCHIEKKHRIDSRSDFVSNLKKLYKNFSKSSILFEDE